MTTQLLKKMAIATRLTLTKVTNIRSVCFLASVLSLACFPSMAQAQTSLRVTMGSGGDDLRGGNRAFMTLVLVNGHEIISQPRELSTGLGSGRTVTTQVTFPGERINANQIRSIRIRHDGTPRPGHPFDWYDNWDLRTLQVTLIDGSSNPVLYRSVRDSRAGDFVRTFTSDLRQIDLPIRPIGTEPDFMITRIVGTPSGLNMVVRNVGLGEGRLTSVGCSAFGRAIQKSVGRTLGVNQETSVSVSFPAAGTITCSPIGVDRRGNPEAVTANNNFSVTLPGR